MRRNQVPRFEYYEQPRRPRRRSFRKFFGDSMRRAKAYFGGRSEFASEEYFRPPNDYEMKRRRKCPRRKQNPNFEYFEQPRRHRRRSFRRLFDDFIRQAETYFGGRSEEFASEEFSGMEDHRNRYPRGYRAGKFDEFQVPQRQRVSRMRHPR